MDDPVRRITGRGLREAAGNLVAALLYLAFASVHLRAFALSHRPSLLLLVGVETLVAVLFLLRSPAERTSTSPYAWLTTLGGTFTPLLLRPPEAAGDVPLGQLVQCVGAALSVYALMSLNSSFGLLPAVRKVRIQGPYRFVRHPLYATYTIQQLGYLVSNATLANLAIVAVAFAFQVLRVHEEERVLSTVPAYESYKQRTRWRLIPLVF
jgi:protein-S-isoprenylcysteine O-methyltransferase Ste14